MQLMGVVTPLNLRPQEAVDSAKDSVKDSAPSAAATQPITLDGTIDAVRLVKELKDIESKRLPLSVRKGARNSDNTSFVLTANKGGVKKIAIFEKGISLAKAIGVPSRRAAIKQRKWHSVGQSSELTARGREKITASGMSSPRVRAITRGLYQTMQSQWDSLPSLSRMVLGSADAIEAVKQE